MDVGMENVAAQIERLTRAFLKGARSAHRNQDSFLECGAPGGSAFGGRGGCAGPANRARNRGLYAARRCAVCVPCLQYLAGRRNGVGGDRGESRSHGPCMKIFAGGCRVYDAEDGNVSQSGSWTTRCVISTASGAKQITQAVPIVLSFNMPLRMSQRRSRTTTRSRLSPLSIATRKQFQARRTSQRRFFKRSPKRMS